MILKILSFGNTIKEIENNPGSFAGSQAKDVIIGLLILPLIITILGLIFLFILAFTTFLGGPYILFKIIFFVAVFVSFFLGFVIHKLTSFLRQTTKNVVNHTFEKARDIEVVKKNQDRLNLL